jgi:hypothetical protein
MQALDCGADVEADPNDKSVDPPPEDYYSDTRLINAAKSKGQPIPPIDICSVMSKASTRHVNLPQTQYHVSFHDSLNVKNLSLIDQGANGGAAGEDVRVIFRISRTADIKGIDNHHMNDIGIGTVGGVANTQNGPVIAFMHQCAWLGNDASIHSSSQLEWYKNDVNDKSVREPGGIQRLTTLSVFVIPLTIKDGLARLNIRPHRDHEYETLPHVFLTSEVEWDPTVLDHDFTDESEWGEDNPEIVDLISASAYNEFGQYCHCVEVNKHVYFARFNSDDIDDHIDQCVATAHSTEIEPEPSTINVPKTINKI